MVLVYYVHGHRCSLTWKVALTAFSFMVVNSGRSSASYRWLLFEKRAVVSCRWQSLYWSFVRISFRRVVRLPTTTKWEPDIDGASITTRNCLIRYSFYESNAAYELKRIYIYTHHLDRRFVSACVWILIWKAVYRFCSIFINIEKRDSSSYYVFVHLYDTDVQ